MGSPKNLGRNAAVLAAVLGMVILGSVLATALGADTGRGLTVDPIGKSEGYRVRTSVQEYRSDLSSADVVTLTDSSGGISAITTYYCGGFPSVTVSGKHSAASATVVVHVYRCLYDATNGLTVLSKTKATLTAEGTLTDGSTSTDYMSTNSATFDTEGAQLIKVVIEAPSSGNVDLMVGAY